MRAAVMEEPGRLVVRQLPEPVPGEYEALCSLLFGSICAGTDQHLVAGHAPFCHWVKYPAILGHESVGRVVKVGSKVRHLKVGDLIARVGTTPVGGVNIGWGGFADFGIATDWKSMQEDGVAKEKWNGFRMQRVLPANTDPAAATMLITWRETFSYIKRMGAGSTTRAVIVGSGGNGLAFARHAVNLGATSTIVVGSVSRRAEVEQLGATFVDYRQADVSGAIGKACPQGTTLLIDAVGKAGTLDVALPRLVLDAVVGVYGLDELPTYRFNPMLAPCSFKFYLGGYDEAEVHDEVMSLMQAGKLNASDFLTNFGTPFELEEIGLAIEAVKLRACVKSLVRISQERV